MAAEFVPERSQVRETHIRLPFDLALVRDHVVRGRSAYGDTI